MAEIIELGTELEQDAPVIDQEEKRHAEEQFDLFDDLYRNFHKKYLDDAAMYERFYRGDQWAEADLKKLQQEGRPALTLNMVLSTINTFLGEQIARRADIQYRPIRDASKDEAHALSKVAMSINDANQYDWKETEMVEDGVIRNRGYLDYRVSFDKNMQGDVIIKNLHPDSVVLERDTKNYDPKEWPGVIVTTWESLEEIEARFGPEKAEQVKKLASHQGTLGGESIQYDDNEGSDQDPGAYNSRPWDIPFYTEESTRRIKSVRLIDRQFYKNVRIFSLVHPESLQQRELPPGTKEKAAKQMADQAGLFLRAKTVRRLYWRVTADRVVLFDDWSPYKTPTVIPYFPYFRKGEAFGIVKNLISPQEQYNKVSSQELHIVNSTANGGWIVKRGSLTNMTIDELAQNGSKTGVVIESNDVKNVSKIQPNQIPTGITNIKRDSQAAVRNIAGMSDSFVGANGDEISGVAMKSKEQRGQAQIQKPLDNLARTRYLMGRKLMELIQDFYTDARIISTVDYETPGMPSEEVEMNMPQEDGSVLNAFERGVFETNIATMPARDSYDDSQFAEILNLISVGVPIPGYHAVRYSHLQHKDAIADELKQMAGLQAPTEEEIEMQQIQQQLQLQDMQISLQEKEARVKELLSKVDLNAAKTANEMTEDDRELRRLMKEMQTERESYKTRLQLAQMQGTQKLDAIDMSTRGDVLKQTLGGSNAKAT